MAMNYPAPSPDGHTISWRTWDHEHLEVLTLQWENEAWTAMGSVGREAVEYVLRISPTWQVRQFLLFRDLEEPDLWLATDGRARWGEMNGAHRTDLDGCVDLDLPCTPFTHSLPIRRFSLAVGDSAELIVARVDVETLGVVPVTHRYTRIDEHRWRFEDMSSQHRIEFDVDPLGFVLDTPEHFRRVPAPTAT